jgi:hypothetical protein
MVGTKPTLSPGPDQAALWRRMAAGELMTFMRQASRPGEASPARSAKFFLSTRSKCDSLCGFHGGRSSMVELQFVVLAVAGSSPVGRPPLLPLKRVSVAGCGARLVPVTKAFRAFPRVSLISLTRDWHILFCSTVDTGKIVLRFKD